MRIVTLAVVVAIFVGAGKATEKGFKDRRIMKRLHEKETDGDAMKF